MGDVNILLLGETGVGKTTLSDSILNYVKYESLNDVKFQSSSGTEEIIIGIDNNECQINIMSDTQHPTTNSLQYNGRRINITDTPGLGDTRGLGYDARNANAVINYLNRFDHLHGICLLLKPTDIRCNASFNFCVQKILSQLNRDVLNNVVFVFTNARSKNYKADDAKRSLNETLRKIGSSLSVNETNTFYFDNESLGYLTAKGANFLDVYQQSWDKSKSESERLLNHIISLRPSSTKILVTLRDANVIIASLAQPLIKIIAEHQRSIEKIKLHRQSIENHQDSIEELKTRLWVPVFQYNTTTKTITDKKVHHNANVGFSLVEIFLGKGKYAYDRLFDTHIEEVTEPYETKREDATVKADLLTESNKLKLVEKTLEELQRLEGELSEEWQIIVEAAVKFMKYLKKNGAIEMSNAFLDRIKKALTEKEGCGESDFTTTLEDLLVNYNLKMDDSCDVTEDHVKSAISDLLNLKHSSAVFRRIYIDIKRLLE